MSTGPLPNITATTTATTNHATTTTNNTSAIHAPFNALYYSQHRRMERLLLRQQSWLYELNRRIHTVQGLLAALNGPTATNGSAELLTHLRHLGRQCNYVHSIMDSTMDQMRTLMQYVVIAPPTVSTNATSTNTSFSATNSATSATNTGGPSIRIELRNHQRGFRHRNNSDDNSDNEGNNEGNHEDNNEDGNDSDNEGMPPTLRQLLLGGLLAHMLNGGASGNSMESVSVSPSAEQLRQATTTTRFGSIINPFNTQCPITMDQFQPNDQVVQLNHCHHIFTESGSRDWFQSHVLCPICRHDVRE
jgi:hypothetical protein